MFAYLTTDPTILGVLAWASAAITVLGFAVAICQILKVKRAAEAAHTAALGLAKRVRSRELLAKLGEAHSYLDAARDHVARGERQPGVMRLELALGCANDAREISRTLPGSSDELAILVLALRDLREQLAATVDPLIDDPGFTPLQLQLGRVADRFRGILSQTRYAYDVPGERDG